MVCLILLVCKFVLLLPLLTSSRVSVCSADTSQLNGISANGRPYGKCISGYCSTRQGERGGGNPFLKHRQHHLTLVVPVIMDVITDDFSISVEK